MTKTYTISRKDLKKNLSAKACAVQRDGQAPAVRDQSALVAVLRKMLCR